MAIIHEKMMKSGHKPKNESKKDKHLSIYWLSYPTESFPNQNLVIFPKQNQKFGNLRRI
jgi:hypothetical protein